MKRQRGSKSKEKLIDFGVRVAKSYATKGTEKKKLVDAMKASKSSTTKR